MGSSLRPVTHRTEESLRDLATRGGTTTRTVAVDSYTWFYAFMHKIRDHENGEPLRDSSGRVTSHLHGLFFRTANMIEAGLRPVFVLDGGFPDLKREEIEKRNRSRAQAQEAYELAEAMGDDDKMRKLEIERRGVSGDMIDTAVKVMGEMGCPVVRAPQEADAQCARMCERGHVDYVISTDYDTLLYGSPNVVQNLTSDGGELVSLHRSLDENDLTYTELIWYGLLKGTDYNQSPHGVGDKTARKIISHSDSFSELLNAAQSYDSDIDAERWRSVFRLFTRPEIGSLEYGSWNTPRVDSLVEILCEEHDFRESRVIDRARMMRSELQQSSLGDF